jgi:hypothetical protein
MSAMRFDSHSLDDIFASPAAVADHYRRRAKRDPFPLEITLAHETGFRTSHERPSRLGDVRRVQVVEPIGDSEGTIAAVDNRSHTDT